jgi:hypothetical protein
MWRLLEALIGSAFGAAAGGGGAEGYLTCPQQQAEAARRSASAQGFFREQEAGLQNIYAQGAMGAYGYEEPANSTITVNPFYPPWRWMQVTREVADESDKKVGKDSSARLANSKQSRSEEPLQVAVEHGYAAIQVEAHEDFAIKLAARPEEKNHGTKEPV